MIGYIHDTAICLAIFAIGMLVGYLLKVVIENKKIIKEK